MDVRTGAPLSARELPALLERVHGALTDRRDVLDDLNVFPVPDGDTGTNMTLTVRAALQELRDTDAASGVQRSRDVIRGAIRGARGNSGVILSQVIRAVVEELTGHHEVDAATYARALTKARTLAYDAVAEPVEGTILTAISAAADAAEAAVRGGASLVDASARTCAAVADAVTRTLDQLEVLRAAGVVDAGARGFEVVLAAVHGHLTGEDPAVHLDEPAHAERQRDDRCHGSLVHPFEVQYLLDAHDDVAPVLRRALEGLGDSVVVVAAGGLLNVHVHTGQVGPAIEAGLDHGRPSSIEVTHFGDQMAARAAASHTAVGAVAVLSGAGITAIARTMQAVVIDGASGSLPPVADLLAAIVDVSAHQVVVLPGHRNVLSAAQQAADVAQREHGSTVRVLESAVTPPSVLAALAVLDPDGDPGATMDDMAAAAAAVRAGEVVAAIRAADTPVGSVRAGQFLGVADRDVVAVDDDPVAVLRAVLHHLDAAAAEILTLLVGADVKDDEAEAVTTLLADAAPSADVEVIAAGQRPSRYWVGVE